MGFFIGSNRLLNKLRTIRDNIADVQKNIADVQKKIVNQSINQSINQLSNRITKIEYYIQDLKIILNNNIYMHPEQDDKYSWDGRRFKNLHRLLEVKDVKDARFVRIGREYDGGYIMLDNFHKNMIAYSYGISNDVSWELDMANHHIHSYMYDHTITSLPQESQYFHWRKEGICGIKKTDYCNTLDFHINNNGHASNKNLILKMDVEGAEWDALINLDEKTLNQFQQMVFEFHYMYDPHYYSIICSVLEKLNKTHQCVHVHGNNYGPRKCSNKLVIPHALEVLYVRKESYEFLPSRHFYPREFDMPCNPSADEIILGYWNL